jgi:predicted Fe-S protein YdhL (DUF1289 family)
MQTSLPFVFWIAIVTTANIFVANGFAVVDTAISPHQSRTFGTSCHHYRHHHRHRHHDGSFFLLLFDSSKQGGSTMSWQAAAEDPSDNSDNHNNTKDTNNNNDNNNNIPVTPCNQICRYNVNVFDGQVCIRCYRDTHEIASWASMDATKRYWTLLDAMDRIHDKNNGSN